MLVPRLANLGYPEEVLVLGLLAHKGPRVLQVGLCASEVMNDTGRSIVAGCLQSCSWARGLLHELMRRLSTGQPRIISKSDEHVDDISHVLAGEDRAEVKKAGIEAGRLVSEGMSELDLQLSDKSVLLPASSATARSVVSILRREGVQIKAATQAEDVGIGSTAGRRRAAFALDGRLKKGAKRAGGIRRLTKVTKKARKLVRTGLVPQQEYGHQVQGASPAQVAKMRRSAKLAAAVGGRMACTTTALEWALGRGKDPAVSIPVQQLASWADAWAASGLVARKKVQESLDHDAPRPG